MTREINFRVFAKETGMVYGRDGICDIQFDDEYVEVWDEPGPEDQGTLVCDLSEVVFEQYTGIDFAKGTSPDKGIYQSDIVRLQQASLGDPESLTGIVGMLEGQWMVTNAKQQRSLPLFQETMLAVKLGNIHENPELWEAAGWTKQN